jgi:hypothetical protein
MDSLVFLSSAEYFSVTQAVRYLKGTYQSALLDGVRRLPRFESSMTLNDCA